MRKSIILFALAYITGLLLGHGFFYFPFATIIAAAAMSSTAVLFGRRSRLPFSTLFIILAICLIGMAAYITSAGWVPRDHYSESRPFDKETHTITGTITSSLDRNPDRTGFDLGLQSIDNKTVSGSIRVSVREEITHLGYGDTVFFSAKLLEPGAYANPGGFDYPAHLARNGIYRVASVKSEDCIQVLSQGTGLFRRIQDWRERIRHAFLASIIGPGSAILQAMVIGEEGGMTDELRDWFMAAGVTHIISISGSHLGMVALLCFGLIRGIMLMLPEQWYHRLTLMTDPKKIAAWITLPLMLFYTLLAGGQMATIRSLIMISAGLLALILDRENALLHSLVIAALLILAISPQAILDISFQLSFISVLVIGALVSTWNDLVTRAETRLERLRQGTFLLILVSLAASIATGPLVAHYFNQISIIGIVSNLIVVPFAGMVVVPLGLLSGIVSLLTGYLPLAGLNQFAADLFISMVFFFSRLPFAEFHPVSPGLLWLTAYAVFFLSLTLYVRARLIARFKPLESSTRPPYASIIGMAVSGPLLALLLIPNIIPRPHAMVSFPDLGQGDCALIELRDGRRILIDGGGTHDNRFDIGRKVLAPFLWNKGIRSLDLVILSHPHPDHMNGLVAILNKFDVAEVWLSNKDTDLPGFDAFNKALEQRHVPYRNVSADDPPVKMGTTLLRVLHPSGDFSSHARKAYAAENDQSLVLLIEVEGNKVLFPGDIGAQTERYILRAHPDLKAEAVKIPHHGSKSSSCEAFVAAVHPQIAVVTASRSNPYGHPAAEVLERYISEGAKVCRTDRDGAITLVLRKDGIEVRKWRDNMLRRIIIKEWRAWKQGEADNWKRLWITAGL